MGSDTGNSPSDQTARKARFEELVRSGYTFAAAAKAVGADQRTYRRWFSRAERDQMLRETTPTISSSDVPCHGADEASPVKVRPTNAVIQAKAFEFLSTSKHTPERLAIRLGLEVEDIPEILEALRSLGFRILEVNGSIKVDKSKEPPAEAVSKVISREADDTLYFGYVSDTHLCSTKHRADVLEAAYDCFAKRGIRDVFHTGNLVDGDFKYNRYEITHRGATGQAHHALEAYPKRDGITTWFIAADDHEGWWMQDMGLNWGEYFGSLCRNHGREDLRYVGYMEADLLIPAKAGHTYIRLLHPGKGTPYAVSYSAQKIIEGYPVEEQPDILLLGHYHKNLTMLLRNIYIIYGGSTQDQTTFLRKNAVSPAVGFYVIEAFRSATGRVLQLNNEWHGYRPGTYSKPQEITMHSIGRVVA